MQRWDFLERKPDWQEGRQATASAAVTMSCWKGVNRITLGKRLGMVDRAWRRLAFLRNLILCEKSVSCRWLMFVLGQLTQMRISKLFASKPLTCIKKK